MCTTMPSLLRPGVAVQSTVISSRDGANLAFYGRQHTAQALLTGSAVPPPPAASALYQVLLAVR
jgi:lipid-binding SYLF domain-containing protein